MNFSVEIRGVVQGVGFRPFIYNKAHSLGLDGYVTNNGVGVLIFVSCSKESLEWFVKEIKRDAPPLSKIESIVVTPSKNREVFKDFEIRESQVSSHLSLQIPPDVAMCEECLAEMQDKNNRRYQYPFITCTNCGPRFSIIKNLPYDRRNTSMDEFKMCKACQEEYENPADRRYHAQPIGCFDCGVTLSLYDKDANSLEMDNVVDRVAAFIKDAKIVALKGIGGYHLLCDARNDVVVKRLRELKRRVSKPFAIMLKDSQAVKNVALMGEKEEELLNSNRRPIVLLKLKESNALSALVAPNLNQVGVFLAYTPLHHLLLEKLDTPIVATSANLSKEPLARTKEEIMKLSGVWDYCLDNDREILNSCDDSIAFVENSKIFTLREARGYSPRYLPLHGKSDKKILALGANQKSSVVICVENKAILSPYVGDLETIKSLQRYKSNIERLEEIYNFKPDVVVCDKHPNYESTKYAKELCEENGDIELIQVQHHYAHILATMGVNDITSRVLGVSFDGTGYGDDGVLWGGEFFVCDRESYERVAHFKEFRLLGAEKAIMEPRRVALSFLFELYGDEVLELKHRVLDTFTQQELKALFLSWKKALNSPLTSSCGRLFDAVASAFGIIHVCSYEGESGLLMESLYDENVKESYDFDVVDGVIDFSEIFRQILMEEDKRVGVSKFFNVLVEIIYFMSEEYKLPVVLGGGVFQNRVLLRLIMKKIPDVIVPEGFMSNDGAIAYGQAIAATSSVLKV